MSLDSVTAKGRRRQVEQFRSTCIRRRFPIAKDEYGNDVRDLNSPQDVALPCRLVQTEAREVTVDRETQVSDWELILAWDADVEASDQIIMDGVTYEVLGPPDPGRIAKTARLRHVA